MSSSPSFPSSSSSPSESSHRPSAVPYRSSRWPARFLVWTGVGHNIVGFLIPAVRQPFVDALKGGYINQLGTSISRRHSFWFFMAGVNLVLLGKLVDWYLFPEQVDGHRKIKDDSSVRAHSDKGEVRSERKLPRELGVWFLGIAIGGATAIPKSGFYLLGIQGLAILFAK
ncbi:hypothetical protein BC939DRAFT_504483 [Gamsiella multidivaricata]|uniref:uncharacterized protein n=1 Tax=Gamsiella multidivaricata TaxID=101098 RepID=UPI00221ED228|nr:uncharacterized protein BC939DRAFT_504483 [Gamsiella multidivaricata]KAI7821167.1 hypothetical protein BC939DRAFT_504483 [Gamsiella multidivaricata]